MAVYPLTSFGTGAPQHSERFVLRRITCLAGLMNLIVLSPLFSAEPVFLATAANCDERLFLTYVVHDLYDSLPADFSEGEGLQDVLIDVRRRAARFRLHCTRQAFDVELISLFDDYLTVVDGYVALLEQIGRIERGAVAQQNVEAIDTAAKAGFSGGAAAAQQYMNGATGTDSALAGLAVAALSAFIDDYQKSAQRDERKLAAFKTAKAEFDRMLLEVAANLEDSEAELTTRHGWGSHETRSTDTDDEIQRLAEAANAGDLAVVRQFIGRRIERRPRDLSLLLGAEYLVVEDELATPQMLLAGAQRCVQHAAMIPTDTIYDGYRAETARDAANLASVSWKVELDGKSWAMANNSTAQYSVSLWDTALKYAPADVTGEWREQRVWSLMAGGFPDIALRQAKEIYPLRKTDGGFAYKFARLLSHAQLPNDAFTSFTVAVRQFGYDVIATGKLDPDLANMRESKAQELADLAAVKVAWDVNFGILNDDIVLTNHSVFPITNVSLACRIESNGKVWALMLSCQDVMPGETYKWANAVSIPGGKVDRKSATIACDQNRQ